jgi:hypothetical protein
VTDQRKQLTTVAKVKGSGMLLADFVCKTVFSEASGEPNMAMQKRTARFPMIEVGSRKGKRYMKLKVAAITAKLTFTCCRIDPGRVGALGGAYFENFKK